VIDSRKRAATEAKRRAVQQHLNASQYSKDGSQTAAYMSVKCDGRSLYPYAVGAGAPRMLPPCGMGYDGGVVTGCDDEGSNVDNEYAYVDELLPPPPPLSVPSTVSCPLPPSRDYSASTAAGVNNNNAYAPRARQSVPDHVTGYLLTCGGPYDMASHEDRLRVNAAAN